VRVSRVSADAGVHDGVRRRISSHGGAATHANSAHLEDRNVSPRRGAGDHDDRGVCGSMDPERNFLWRHIPDAWTIRRAPFHRTRRGKAPTCGLRPRPDSGAARICRRGPYSVSSIPEPTGMDEHAGTPDGGAGCVPVPRGRHWRSCVAADGRRRRLLQIWAPRQAKPERR
jgi:hypothetical protein